MTKKIILIGAGGHSRVIQDILLESGSELYGILDDNAEGANIIGKIEDIDKYKKDYQFIIAIGSNKIREKISKNYNVEYAIAIHPSAVVSKNVVIGAGTVIMASAVVNSTTQIGKHCIINTGAVIDHDNTIEDYVHISPNATLSGTVSVGKTSWVGAGSVVINNINIGENTIIGAGSVVLENTESNIIVIGNPAKFLKINK